MRDAPPNPHGLTHLASYDDWTSSPQLQAQLTDAEIVYERRELPQIGGMGGNAHLILYTSARTGGPVTVLVVPQLVEDQYSEDYYYFAGMAVEQAGTVDWILMYDACQDLGG
jgi:hypothetical protein